MEKSDIISERYPALKAGGVRGGLAAAAEHGDGGGPCHIVCPSDLAPAFMAYDARIGIAGPGGTREVILDDFFVGPKVDPHRENILKPDEIVTGLRLPLPQGETSSVFIKVRERRSWDFALASIALVVSIENGSIRNAGLVLGGAAPNPWRAAEAEAMLEGAAPGSVDPDEVAAAVIKKSRPLKGNRYKVDIAQNIVKRALKAVLVNQSS